MLSLDKFLQNNDLFFVVGLIFGILVFATVLYFVWGKINPNAKLKEVKDRTRSWWTMATIFVSVTLFNPKISYIGIAFLSFFALREMISMSKNVRESDRGALIFCYLAVPFQYYLAYRHWYGGFLIFIPVFMFLWIPFMLVIRGDVKDITRSMSVLPTQLMFCVFGISHLAYLLSLPEIEGFHAGGKGLVLFLVFITEMNDVFQFTWGKLFGKFKIIPKVSPNKTWEGFIGGVLTTTVVGYFLRFLTPLSGYEAIAVSLIIALTGFVGDVVVSAIKRDFGLKDTGSVIPGHGGILDRIDSLAIAAPVFFHLIYFLHY